MRPWGTVIVAVLAFAAGCASKPSAADAYNKQLCERHLGHVRNALVRGPGSNLNDPFADAKVANEDLKRCFDQLGEPGHPHVAQADSEILAAERRHAPGIEAARDAEDTRLSTGYRKLVDEIDAMADQNRWPELATRMYGTGSGFDADVAHLFSVRWNDYTRWAASGGSPIRAYMILQSFEGRTLPFSSKLAQLRRDASAAAAAAYRADLPAGARWLRGQLVIGTGGSIGGADLRGALASHVDSLTPSIEVAGTGGCSWLRGRRPGGAVSQVTLQLTCRTDQRDTRAEGTYEVSVVVNEKVPQTCYDEPYLEPCSETRGGQTVYGMCSRTIRKCSGGGSSVRAGAERRTREVIRREHIAEVQGTVTLAWGKQRHVVHVRPMAPVVDEAWDVPAKKAHTVNPADVQRVAVDMVLGQLATGVSTQAVAGLEARASEALAKGDIDAAEDALVVASMMAGRVVPALERHARERYGITERSRGVGIYLLPP
jgi:hypothetical protein